MSATDVDFPHGPRGSKAGALPFLGPAGPRFFRLGRGSKLWSDRPPGVARSWSPKSICCVCTAAATAGAALTLHCRTCPRARKDTPKFEYTVLVPTTPGRG